MPRRFCLGLLTALVLLSLAAGKSYGLESSTPPFVLHDVPPLLLAAVVSGAYLSWLKLLLVAIVFVIWVRLADWINRDAMKIGERTKLLPEIWNPVTTGSFLLGLLFVLFVPIFYVGYPVYVLGAFVPFLIYFFMRRSKFKAAPELKQQLSGKPGDAPPPPPLPQDAGAAIDFSAAGNDSNEQQVNLIRARQSAGFPLFKDLIADGLLKRADVMLMDYSREKVVSRMQIDGVWHPLPVLDRQTGDAVLVSLKSLAGLNAADRRGQQTGKFNLKTELEKAGVEVLTQGVPTGERIQVKFLRKKKTVMTLGQLGMFPEMIEQLRKSLNKPGLAIISAPAGQGLTASWQGALMTADRMTRDCVAILEERETDTTVENIAVRRYDSAIPNKMKEVTKATLLSQPHLVAYPDLDNAEIMDVMTQHVIQHKRSVLLRATAGSAAEALLKTVAIAGNRNQFATAVSHATGQRLIRRLCDECKQEVRVPPKTIQQLGGDPKQQSSLFNQYRLPPPEQRIDEKGKPIEFPPCPVCRGIGYIGRIGVFELIEVDESIRAALLQKSDAQAIESLAQKSGKNPLVKQAYKLVLLGLTSMAEVQRVFK